MAVPPRSLVRTVMGTDRGSPQSSQAADITFSRYGPARCRTVATSSSMWVMSRLFAKRRNYLRRIEGCSI